MPSGGRDQERTQRIVVMSGGTVIPSAAQESPQSLLA